MYVCVCMHAHMCLCVYVSVNTICICYRTGCHIPQSWTFRLLCAAWRGCWEVNSGLPREYAFLNTDPSLQTRIIIKMFDYIPTYECSYHQRLHKYTWKLLVMKQTQSWHAIKQLIWWNLTMGYLYPTFHKYMLYGAWMDGSVVTSMYSHVCPLAL